MNMRRLLIAVFSLIGVATVAFAMDINGQLKNAQFEKVIANPSVNEVEGRVVYDTVDDQIRYYDGSAWMTIADTASALVNPMDDAGQIIYGGASGSVTKLAAGTSGQALFSAGTSAPVWTGLADGKVWVGDGSNLPVAVTPSGDVTMTNAGVTAIAAGVIVDADVNASAAIAGSKLAAATNSVAGAVTTSAQSFAGVKTFYDGVKLDDAAGQSTLNRYAESGSLTSSSASACASFSITMYLTRIGNIVIGTMKFKLTKDGTANQVTISGLIPSGFRPAQRQVISYPMNYHGGGSQNAAAYVDTDGDLLLFRGSDLGAFAASGVSNTAGSGSYYVNFTYGLTGA
jgi:hypothetical protein